MLTKAIPYVIGFPGVTYYEFDLSGQFVAGTAGTTNNVRPAQIGKQTITFASPEGTTIGVSDDEMAGVSQNYSGMKYTFKPNYLNMSFAANSDHYTLKANNGSGISSFDKVPDSGDATPLAAFRPYFVSAPVSSSRPVTRSIIFGSDVSDLKGVEEKGNPNGDDPGNLKIYAGKHKIIVESALTRDIEIRIVNTAGITMSTFTLEPGETVETRIINAGVYIVQSTDGRYLKKLAVK